MPICLSGIYYSIVEYPVVVSLLELNLNVDAVSQITCHVPHSANKGGAALWYVKFRRFKLCNCMCRLVWITHKIMV